MFKFIKTIDTENEFEKTNVSIEIPFNDLTTDDLCEVFADFMKACGFVLDGKHVEVVDDEIEDCDCCNCCDHD